MTPHGVQQTCLLDVCGKGFPLLAAESELIVSSAIEVWGVLRLDAQFEPGGDLDPTARTCRSPWRVAGLRRFAGVGGARQETVPLGRTPAPGEVDESACYVVDLVSRSDH